MVPTQRTKALCKLSHYRLRAIGARRRQNTHDRPPVTEKPLPRNSPTSLRHISSSHYTLHIKL